MLNRSLAAVLVLILFAGGCGVTSPWLDVLDSEEIKKLKEEHTEPIRYKVVVGLRVDPENFARIPADEIGALRDQAKALSFAGKTAVANLSNVQPEALLTPKDLKKKIDRLILDVNGIQAKGRDDIVKVQKALDDLQFIAGPVSNADASAAKNMDAAKKDLEGGETLLREGKTGYTVRKSFRAATRKLRSAAGAMDKAASRSGGALVELTAMLKPFASAAGRFDIKLELLLSGEQFQDQATITALQSAKERSGRAVVSIEGATQDLLRGSLDNARLQINDAVATIAPARDILATEAERLAEDADEDASMEPTQADFIDGFVENLEKFEMFHAVGPLAGVPRNAAKADFIAAATQADADLLILLEPRRNDIAYMGFNANWYYNVLIWAFAWFASNYVPDETWESRLGLDVSVIDVRSGESLFAKNVKSTIALNLNDIDDGYHFLGIVFGGSDREDLQSAYEMVLPANLCKVRKELLKDLAVDFKAYTQSEVFAEKQNNAAPVGFGVVVGVGNYESKGFTSEIENAKEKVAAMAAKASESAQVLNRVADALEQQMGSPGAMGAAEAVQALRKVMKMLEMAGTEFLANDHPVGARSVGEAEAALGAAKAQLAAAEPKPAGADQALATLTALQNRVAQAANAARAFTPGKGAVDLAKAVSLLIPEAQAIPGTLNSTAEKLGDDGKPLAAAVPTMESALQSLLDAEGALSQHDLPTAIRGLEAVCSNAGETLKVVNPLKAKVIEAASVAGKIEFLKAESEKALAKAKGLAVPEALKSLAGECKTAMDETGKIIAGLETEEAKAEGRGKERKKVATAARPVAQTASEVAGLIEAILPLLDRQKGTEAAKRLRNAVKKAGDAAATLAPLVKDLPTLIGEVLAIREALDAVIKAQESAIQKAKDTAPDKGALGDLPKSQREVGQELAKFAGEIEAQVDSLTAAERTEQAEAAKKCAEGLYEAAGVVEEAAEAFELLDTPTASAKQGDAITKIKAVAAQLKNLAPQVSEIGKHAYAMDGVISRQEALIQQTKNVIATMKKPLEPLAAEQEGILQQGGQILARLKAVPGTFPKAKAEEPSVLAAVIQGGEDLAAALQRGGECAAMFRKGDLLGGGREQQNLLDRLQGLGSSLASSIEGKRSHVDWIKQVVADLAAMKEAGEMTAAALQTGASRFEVDKATDDANAFSAFLTDRQGAGFAPNRVKTFLGEEATGEAIKNCFDDLLKNRVLLNDLFVFYFAGCAGLKRVEFANRDEILDLSKQIKKDAERVGTKVKDSQRIEVPDTLKGIAKQVGDHGKAIQGLANAAVKLAGDLERSRDPARVGAYRQAIADLEKAGNSLGETVSKLEASQWKNAATSANAASRSLESAVTRLKGILPPVQDILAAAKSVRALASEESTIAEGAYDLQPADPGKKPEKEKTDALASKQAALMEKIQSADMALSELLPKLAGKPALQEAVRSASTVMQDIMQEKAPKVWEALQGGDVGKAGDLAGKTVEQMEALARNLENGCAGFREIGDLMLGLADIAQQQKTAASTVAKLPATTKQGSEVTSLINLFSSLSQSISDRTTTLQGVAETELREDEARAQAGPALEGLAARFEKPASLAAEAAKALGSYGTQKGAASANAAAAALREIAETLAGLPSAPGIADFRADIVAQAKALEGFATGTAVVPKSSRVDHLIEDINALVELLAVDAQDAARLREALIENVPEPANSVVVADERFQAALEALKAAVESFENNAILGGQEKLKEALDLLTNAAGTIDKMVTQMDDLFARYILPYDADPARPEETGISLFAIGQLISSLETDHALVIFDTSVAPGMPKRGFGTFEGEGPKKLTEDYVDYVVRRPGWTAIFAGQPNQGAGQGDQGGHLTQAILEGLGGAADADGNGKIAVSELQAYLEKAVEDRAQKKGLSQKPLVRSQDPSRLAVVPSNR
ncbi:MAG: hypothetical protein ACYTHM_00470 [Planctomycetota bacterium]|jgi:hypothetical protein